MFKLIRKYKFVYSHRATLVKLKSSWDQNGSKYVYFKYKYSDKVEAAVNMQIQAEQQVGQDYLNMAVYFLHPAVSRPGVGGYFMKMYEEELEHMKMFIEYQLIRGGTCHIDSLQAPHQEPGLTLLAAFQKALAMEKAITELLQNLVSTAELVKDYQCADFVTSVFLAEQMKAVNAMSHHVTELSRLTDEHGLYHYDLQLKERFPYSFKRSSCSSAPGKSNFIT